MEYLLKVVEEISFLNDRIRLLFVNLTKLLQTTYSLLLSFMVYCLIMIPLKLTLKNFVSYGAVQEIDFSPYHLICLSGKNGHGKSALLDALSWVLWGQARKTGGTAKAEEGLLRLGQDHMMVSLDFACNGIHYRVRREYMVSAQKAQTILEFGIVDGDILRPLTDKTIRATQAKLDAMIGLDYDSFINTAFLKQGQSNEFSKKSAKERKEILARILGLHHFEEIRRLALDKVREAQIAKEHSAQTVERLNEEIALTPRILEQLKEAETALSSVFEQETALQVQLEEFKRKMQLITVQKNSIEKLSFQKQHLENSLAVYNRTIIEAATAWRKFLHEQRTALAQVDVEKERTILQGELQQLQILAARKIELKEEYLIKKDALKQYIQVIKDRFKQAEEQAILKEQSLLITLKNVQDALQLIEGKKKNLEAEYTRLDTELTSLQVMSISEESISHAEKTLERKKSYYHIFVTKAQSLTSQLSALSQKKLLVSSTDQARCPLCDQPADKESLCATFEIDEKRYTHQRTRLTRIIGQLKAILINEHEKLQELKTAREREKLTVVKKEGLEIQKIKLAAERTELTITATAHQDQIIALHAQKEEILKERTALQKAQEQSRDR